MPKAIPSATDTSTSAGGSSRSATKRRKHHHTQQQSLLPGLPDHIAQLCLSLVPPSVLYSVCRSWRRLIYSPSFPPFLSIYALLLSKQTTDQTPTQFSNSLELSSFDPISSKWDYLPPPPEPSVGLLLHHPSFISRNMPIQSVTVAGKLVLLAGTADHFLPALPRPMFFSPCNQKWSFGPSLAAPRRWCVAGASRNTVYVASGIGSKYSSEVARSVEKWDLDNNDNGTYLHHRKNRPDWKWEKMGDLRDGKFSRDAVDAIAWRGKLCMVNVKGDAAKVGAVYEVGKDAWEEMPDGMLRGWRGPAAAMEEETIFMVDESKGALRKYEAVADAWVGILEDERLRGAEHIAAGGGKVCVVCEGGVSILVVDVVESSPHRLWVVNTPPGFEAVDIHILPRMSRPDELLTPLLADSQSME